MHDLPKIFKCFSLIEKQQIETDSLQSTMIIELVNGHNVIVHALNTVLETTED